MTLETFFEKFNLFADAPGAVGKMRELVLELAVQGRLVDQKHSDGNAAQLLNAICKERDTWGAKLRTPNEPASADGKEPAFPIAPNWAWTQLGNIALQIQYGYTASADPSATEIRLLRITDIQNNRVDWPSVPGCQIELDEAEKYLLNPNDILIARTGGTIGKSYIVSDAPVKSIFASYLIRVTPPHSMVARFLKTFLESPLYWSQLRQMSAGTGQPNVNGQALGRLEIPLPPLAEQHRIVAKVDELMALCDRLEAQQQERETRHANLARAALARFADAPTPANLNFLFHPSYTITPADLRKTILSLAVQGKLVPQDSDDEPARMLVKRVAGLREQYSPSRRAKLLMRIKELDDVRSSHDVPDSWTWCRLGDLVLDFRYGTSRKCVRNVNGVPVLRIPNIKNGRIDSTDLKFTDMPPAEFKELRLQEGDLLLVRSNGSENLVGRSAVASIDDERFAYAGYIVRARLPKKEVFASFLHVVLSTSSVRDQIEGPIRTTSGVKNINTTELSNLVLPLPPLAEQRRIVAKVDQLMALVDELEARLSASRAMAENLLTALEAELTGTTNGRKVAASPAKPATPAPRPLTQPVSAAPIAPASPPSVPATPAPPAAPKTARTLTELRKAVGLSQTAVAKAMSLNQAYISQMETGKRVISDEQLRRLAEILVGMLTEF